MISLYKAIGRAEWRDAVHVVFQLNSDPISSWGSQKSQRCPEGWHWIFELSILMWDVVATGSMRQMNMYWGMEVYVPWGRCCRWCPSPDERVLRDEEQWAEQAAWIGSMTLIFHWGSSLHRTPTATRSLSRLEWANNFWPLNRDLVPGYPENSAQPGPWPRSEHRRPTTLTL